MGLSPLDLLQGVRLPEVSIAWNVVVAYAFGLFLLYVAIRLLVLPVRFTARLVANTLVGLALLFVFNVVGGFFDVRIPLNPVTAVVAGALGVPGVGLLLALKYFFLS